MRDTNIEAGSLERRCCLICADIQNLAKVLVSPDLSAVNDILSHHQPPTRPSMFFSGWFGLSSPISPWSSPLPLSFTLTCISSLACNLL